MSTEHKRPELASRLLEVRDYRAFIVTVMEEFTKSNSRYSFGKLAKDGGFSSRSFPRDVVTGVRRVTSKSLPAFIRAMKLTGDLAAMFQLLVQLEEKDLRAPNTSDEQLMVKIDKLKNRVKTSNIPVADANHFFAIDNVCEIYSALGPLNEGATKEEIIARTGLSEEVCKKALSEMGEAKFVVYDDLKSRYLPMSPHLIFGDLANLPAYHLHILKMIDFFKEKAVSNFADESFCVVSSVFSINKKKLPLFQKEFKKLITKFQDQAEDPNGDAVAKCVAMLST